ncbi:MAG TPA: hypothetical protein V6C57_23125 [Coleofasciculaceae cyanobacterium]
MISNEEINLPGSTTGTTLLNTLPDARNLYLFSRALKEYIGLGIYRLRGWL